VTTPEHFPPKGEPTYKYYSIWHDSANAMFAAIEYAWEKFDPAILTRLFETKAIMLRSIVDAGGGNRYNLPHWRSKFLPKNPKKKSSVMCRGKNKAGKIATPSPRTFRGISLCEIR